MENVLKHIQTSNYHRTFFKKHGMMYENLQGEPDGPIIYDTKHSIMICRLRASYWYYQCNDCVFYAQNVVAYLQIVLSHGPHPLPEKQEL